MGVLCVLLLKNLIEHDQSGISGARNTSNHGRMIGANTTYVYVRFAPQQSMRTTPRPEFPPVVRAA